MRVPLDRHRRARPAGVGPRRLARLRCVPGPLAAAVLACLVALGAAACGTGGYSKGGDVARGRQLFTKNCASCHTLAAANASGVIGPNLDDAFAADRSQGFHASSIQQIVADQIRLPLQGIGTKAGKVTPTGTPVMPANIVRGRDVTDVAAFVAACAGNQNAPACRPTQGGKVTATDGKTIFQQAGCVNCHTLKDAGSTGTVGPNLDQKRPPKSLVVERVTNGRGAMPAFGTNGTLTPAQIQAVADYVASVAGK
ncbi:MAG TPA: c-type cytochrome [Gaiellaceae bacterium]|nr:c-type cytochrome [Gaiellaceae bacterium]